MISLDIIHGLVKTLFGCWVVRLRVEKESLFMSVRGFIRGLWMEARCVYAFI